MPSAKKLRINSRKPSRIAVKHPAKITVKSNTRLVDTVINRMIKIDDVVSIKANGCYTIPFEENEPRYQIKQLFEYAIRTGKNTSELNDEELAMFLIKQ